MIQILVLEHQEVDSSLFSAYIQMISDLQEERNQSLWLSKKCFWTITQI